MNKHNHQHHITMAFNYFYAPLFSVALVRLTLDEWKHIDSCFALYLHLRDWQFINIYYEILWNTVQIANTVRR